MIRDRYIPCHVLSVIFNRFDSLFNIVPGTPLSQVRGLKANLCVLVERSQTCLTPPHYHYLFVFPLTGALSSVAVVCKRLSDLFNCELFIQDLAVRYFNCTLSYCMSKPTARYGVSLCSRLYKWL